MGERSDDVAVRHRLVQVVGPRSAVPAGSPDPSPPPLIPAVQADRAVQTVQAVQTDRGGRAAGADRADRAGGGGGADHAELPEPERRLPAAGWSSPFDPGRRGVKALAAVAMVVVLVAGFLAWRSRPHAEPVAPDLPGSAASGVAGQAGAPQAGTAQDGAPQAGVTEPAGTEVVVAVAGKVKSPGLVRLPPGSRVADAVAAAGGILPGTDLATVKLARKVTDGELIVVGVPAAAAGDGTGPAGAGDPAAAGGKVNLNTATLSQLDALPGVGPVLAQRIIDYRTSHGGFRSVSELRQVDGIGDARFDDLKDRVTV